MESVSNQFLLKSESMTITRFNSSPLAQDYKFSESNFAAKGSVDGGYKTQELGYLSPSGTRTL